MRLARWAVRRWQGDAEYEDILAEAYLEAWRGYQLGVSRGIDKPLATAARRALWAPREWLAKWFGRQREGCARHRFRHLSLAALDLGVPGFEARLLDRLEQQALVGRVWEVCTNSQRAVLYRLFWLGETKRECAAALGIAETAVHSRCSHALKKARELVKEEGEGHNVPL